MTTLPPTKVPATVAQIADLLERAKSLPRPTPEQIEAQRRSWVIGEMLLEHPEMTYEQVAAIYDKVRS